MTATVSGSAQLIGWLFLVANAGRLLAYFPQILAAARCDAGARSVSLLTWSYFAFAHFTALLYAVCVLHDSRSIWIFCGNLVVTLILVAIVFLKRRRHRLRNTTVPAVDRRRPASARGSGHPGGRRASSPSGKPRRDRLIMSGTDDRLQAGARPGGRRTVMRFGLQVVPLRATR